ncbi:MAG: deoxyribodipyrimidine photo-lyase, partial [Propionivibrio sp.]
MLESKLDSVLVWFRRDLRSDDHVALADALRRARRVYCAFVFDREILDVLSDRLDRRVDFIRGSLIELDSALLQRGGGLIVRHARATDEIPRLAGELGVAAVFANRDYEPQSKRRDAKVADVLGKLGIGFESFKDQVVFDGTEVLTLAGKPYTVFTPYKNAWLKRLTDDDLSIGIHEQRADSGKLVASSLAGKIPALAEIGFAPTDLPTLAVVPGMAGARQLVERFCAVGAIARYAQERDFPALDGGSRLSVHLRFGTVSIRELANRALAHGALTGAAGPATWLSELIWRDFYFMILDHFPHVAERAFKPEYDAIAWESGDLADARFAAWCAGKTGFPLVDAAMRQINTTGYMHNRLR